MEYRDLDPSKKPQMLKKAKEICQKFLNSQSSLELNCSQKEISKVEEAIERNYVNLSTFDILFKEVEKNLKDSLLRFYSSEEYQNFQTKELKQRSNFNRRDSEGEVILSPVGIRESSFKKSTSFDSSYFKRFSLSNVVNKVKDAYQKGSKSNSSPELFTDRDGEIKISLLSSNQEDGFIEEKTNTNLRVKQF